MHPKCYVARIREDKNDFTILGVEIVYTINSPRIAGHMEVSEFNSDFEIVTKHIRRTNYRFFVVILYARLRCELMSPV